MLEQS